MSTVLVALVLTVVVVGLAGLAGSATHRAEPVNPESRPCDRCGRPGPRSQVVTHREEAWPSVWLACPPCAAAIANAEEARHERS